MLGQVANLNNYTRGYAPVFYPTMPYNQQMPNAPVTYPAFMPQYYNQMPVNPYQYIKSYVAPQIKQYQNPVQTITPSQYEIPGITDPTIKEAINKLREVKYLPGDVEHMKKLGVNILFNSGEEAINIIKQNGIKIEFGKMSDPKAHAQFDIEKNLVIINENYRGTKDPATILAISEALFHELGHARDRDGEASVQEETDCLALNTLANRYHQHFYPQVFNSAQNAAILDNGVSLYTKLFFDPDPKKEALTNRIIDRYGHLPMESPNHSLSIAARVSQKLKTAQPNIVKQM